MKNTTVNAGVTTANGIEFQKYCALYFLLDEYDWIKDKNYLIFIEHHEDVLFCYKNEENKIYLINTYQAKKSVGPWNSIPEIKDIIKKITHVGLDLYEDEYPKSIDYKHNLSFVTNDSIKLSNSKKKEERVSLTINYNNEVIKYVDIDDTIKAKLEEGFDLSEKNELKNVYLRYIDLPKKGKQQKSNLVGMCTEVFREKIIDHKAAIDTLLLLMRDVENEVNNGNVARLDDCKKGVSSDEINNSIGIITTKKLAFDFWRKQGDCICRMLNIPIPQRKNFKLNFENCFDRFKDLNQAEHLSILDYVRNKIEFCELTDEVECINWLYEEFTEERSSQLEPLTIKAAIYAAYIEVKEELAWE
ncbi:dsDNA nuclease domain-containing protein [Clostridium butyricum]|uniref:dsDNA nuclease domain-containing protein n=1 Tax=Clostridium butyricum TaxID=1492 RepID=UPI00374E660D